MDKKEVHVLSLGAGVQSTTMLLMACHGEITPRPDFVIFSDTGWEPKKVYEHLAWLRTETAKYGITITETKTGNIREDILKAARGERFASLPFFVISQVPIYEIPPAPEEDDNQISLMEFNESAPVPKVIGYKNKKGMVRRQCTNEYKIKAIRKATREWLGYVPRKRVKEKVIMWKGISTDESQRMSDSLDKWIEFRYPLIDADMSRQDCLTWMENKGYPVPPKSSCIGCPFHDDKMWLDMKQNDPESWADAVEIDKIVRGLPRFKGEAFLHSSLKPLDEVEFKENQLDLNHFMNECAGACGV